MVSVWSDEVVEKLKEYAAKGLSAAQAADEIPGMTRNAAVGIAFRKEFHFQSGRNGKRLRHKAAIPTPISQVIIVDDPFGRQGPLTLEQLQPGDCRWPIGDPQTPEFRFCGGKQRPDKPYCGPHCRIAYESPEARRDAVRKAGEDRRASAPICPR